MSKETKVQARPEAAVADASAFIQGLPFSGELKLYTTPLIEEEIEGLKGMDLLRASTVNVVAPSGDSLKTVQDGARRTGDDARLSRADIEVLALALELGLPILTDDYSIQNLAHHLGIRFVPIREKGIKEELHWSYRCVGCRRSFDEKVDECPVCGSKVKSSRKGPSSKGSNAGAKGGR
jgi:UPF0271 protein